MSSILERICTLMKYKGRHLPASTPWWLPKMGNSSILENKLGLGSSQTNRTDPIFPVDHGIAHHGGEIPLISLLDFYRGFDALFLAVDHGLISSDLDRVGAGLQFRAAH